MQEQASSSPVHANHNECHVCKSTTPMLHTRLIQLKASCWVILIGLQNPRPILGMPRHNSEGLTKLRTNTSLVQGSANPRTTLGKPHITKVPSPWELKVCKVYHWQSLIFLTFIRAWMQAYLKPKVFPWYQNSRSTLGIKTQGTPLVHTLAKPKVCPWYLPLPNPRHPLSSLTWSS